MNNRETYKRVKITWWLIIPFVGIHLHMILGYIHQWGNNPIDKTGFIVMSIIWLFVYILIGRFKVIVDGNFAIFRSDIWVPVKIPISTIENVSVRRVPLFDHYIPEKKCKKFYFSPFLREAVRIQLKSDKTYQVAIKDAERIKEEIEKRMIKPVFYEKQ